MTPLLIFKDNDAGGNEEDNIFHQYHHQVEHILRGDIRVQVEQKKRKFPGQLLCGEIKRI
jgi:hypothetical protein